MLTMRKNTVPLNSERQLFAFAGAKSKPLEKFLGCSSLCAGISQRLYHYASALRGHGTHSSPCPHLPVLHSLFFSPPVLTTLIPSTETLNVL